MKNVKKLILENKCYCLKNGKIIKIQQCNFLECNREKSCRKKSNNNYGDVNE